MSRLRVSGPWGYAAAAGAAVLASLAQLGLDAIAGEGLAPGAALYLAPVVVAWAIGLRQATLTLALAASVMAVGFLPPVGSPTLAGPSGAIRLVDYVAVGAAVIAVVASEREARRRLEREAVRRQEAERRLRESEEHRSCIVELNPQYPWTAAPDGSITDVPPRMLALTGLSREELIGRGWRRAVHPDDLKAADEVWDRSLRSGEPVDVEMRLRRTDGSYRWLRSRAFPRRDEAGRAVRWYGTAEDIHDRKLAELGLRRRHQQYRDLAEAMPQIVYTSGPDGRLSYVNRRWTEYSGLDVDGSRLDADIASAIHPDDLPGMADAWARSLAEGSQFEAQFRIRRAVDGSYRWFLSRAVPIRDAEGRILSWFGTSTDIEEQKRAEQRLREGELRLRLALEASGTGTWEWEPEAGHVSCSPECGRINGLSQCELDGVEANFFRLVHPEDRDRLRAAAEWALQHGTRFEAEFRIVRPDGEVRWASTFGRAVADEPGVRPRRMLGTMTDITARKRDEAERERLSATLDAFIESSTVGLAILDRDFRYLRVNEALAALNALPAGEHLGRTVAEVVPRVWPAVEGIYRRVRDGGGAVVGLELTAAPAWAPAELRTFMISVFPVRVGREGVSCLGLAVTDITARKQAEDARRHAEERLRLAVEVAGLGIMQVDYDADSISLDHAAAAMYGLPANTPVPRAEIHARFHPDDREAMGRHIGRSLDPGGDGWFSAEHRIVLPDGSTRWLNVRKKVFFEGAGPAARPRFGVVAAQDVTASRRQAEALADAHRRLEESYAVLDTLLTTAPVGLAFVDRDGRFARINRAMATLLGRPAAEDLGRRPDEVLPVPWPRFGPLLDRVREAGRPVPNVELRGPTPAAGPGDGDWLASFYPVRVGGQPIGVGVVAVDLTEQKRAERLLREADRRKDDFLAMLAHELRNPLAPIRNAAELLRMGPAGPAEAADSAAIIDRQVGHLARLVDDLLDVARLSRGKIVLRREPVTLSAVLRDAVEAARPALEARRHALEVLPPAEAIEVDGDPTRLTQVVLNLLHNAAKYTPDGGRIRLSAASEGGQAVVRVRDDGVGIPADVLPTIFDPFVQADRSLDRSQGGLGIGLTLVRQLAELHGGSVSAGSDGPGTGSEFVVRLPLRPRASAPRPEPIAVAPPLVCDQERHARRILIVEDHADAARSLARLLLRLGDEVSIAPDGEQALRVAMAERPDVVLLDIGLPGIDGFEVARRLRREPALDGVLLVALTGYGSEADRHQSRAAGFDAHLVKPVEFAALRRLLDASRILPGSGPQPR